jgi:hypothetical protein
LGIALVTVGVRGVVSLHCRDPQPFEIGRAGNVRVAAGDAHTTPHEQLRERAHSRAGDADEVDGTRVGAIEEL